MKPISVMLIDDHAIMRMGLASLLGTRREIKIVGDAGDGESGIRKALKLKPDVIIVDLMMPDMDGAETTRRLIEKMPDAKVLIFTTFGTADGIGHALNAGAKGALMKNAELPELISAIKKIASGEQVIAPEIAQILSQDPPVPELSSRQTQILESITRGLSNEEIAGQLGISLPMVKEHLNRVFTKIGATNRAEAVAIAMRKHLLKL